MENLAINEYVSKLASKSSTPGGGSAAALVGALSIALASMSASLTVDKKGYEEVNEEMKGYKEKFNSLKTELLEYMDKDAKAFDEVMKAYAISKENEGRKEAINQALEAAYKVPYELALKFEDVMEALERCYYVGNKNVQSDAFMAIVLAKATITSCLANVAVNLKLLPESEESKNVRERLAKIASKINQIETVMYIKSGLF